MYALNLSQVIGYVTETPQVRELPSGAIVADVNIEIKSTSTGKNGPAITTTFLNVTVWRRMAEITRDYVTKGSQIFFSGRLETESWEDDQGNKKYKTKMVDQDGTGTSEPTRTGLAGPARTGLARPTRTGLAGPTGTRPTGPDRTRPK